MPSSMISMYSALASRLQNTSAGGAEMSSSEAATASHREAILSSRTKFSATKVAKNASVTLLSDDDARSERREGCRPIAYTSGTPLNACPQKKAGNSPFEHVPRHQAFDGFVGIERNFPGDEKGQASGDRQRGKEQCEKVAIYAQT